MGHATDVDFVVGAARLVLAVVFATAAWTKLLDRTAFRQSVRDLGTPVALAPVVPLLEVAIAVGLLVDATTRGSAVVALALLAAFSFAIGRTLAQGRHPACKCFGQLSAAPIGTATLVRNQLFAALALLVALG